MRANISPDKCLPGKCHRTVFGQKPGGGANGRGGAGWRPDPKFDDYTQNSSDLRSNLKNQPQNNSRA
jgi:hypothetical protein